MENPNHPANKQKAIETSGNSQALQVVTGMPPAPTLAGSAPTTSPQVPPLPAPF
ncbi:UNVERIFIED_CONTAM: hypothetical protein Slati_2224500 [Sesamum latifolium]|uniref:Uncharacterized protein n=1 Tax=Sesamum latifolium TaxID=2727402 RepID=A0AAW2WTZ8_9LAMI